MKEGFQRRTNEATLSVIIILFVFDNRLHNTLEEEQV